MNYETLFNIFENNFIKKKNMRKNAFQLNFGFVEQSQLISKSKTPPERPVFKIKRDIKI